jgi:hypothetical protein
MDFDVFVSGNPGHGHVPSGRPHKKVRALRHLDANSDIASGTTPDAQITRPTVGGEPDGYVFSRFIPLELAGDSNQGGVAASHLDISGPYLHPHFAAGLELCFEYPFTCAVDFPVCRYRGRQHA